MSDRLEARRPDGALAVVRRAPFSENPRVGSRGLRAQQRIVDAALAAFTEAGYHACSIDRITKLARCSRVSFYQYFASKEDVFRHLAGQVARQVDASTEALAPLTPDRAGWDAMRAWVGRYTEIYARYEPVFHALETDDALAAVARDTGEQTITRIHSRLATTSIPPRRIDPVIRLLLQCLNHTLDVRGILVSVTPDAYPDARIGTALTDVLHRTLFGRVPDVNVHAVAGPAPPPLAFGPEMLAMLETAGAAGDDPAGDDPAGAPTFDALIASGREVFVQRGYHATRVDDLVTAAGVSHGAFYRHFDNVDQLARILTARAVRAVSAAVTELPDIAELDGPTGRRQLRRWLRSYNAAHVNEAAMLRVWLDAALSDRELRIESAPLLDWGRRRMARALGPRGFGDPDMDAVVMVALLGVFGPHRRPDVDVEAALHILEHGLLGR